MDQKKWMKHGEIFPVVQTTLTERKTFGESVTNFFFFFFFSGYEKDVCKCGHCPNLLKPIFDVG